MVMDGCGVGGQCVCVGGGHITEVSGWVTRWRVGMNIQRGRSWRGSARPGTGSALPSSAIPRPSTVPGTQVLSEYLLNG